LGVATVSHCMVMTRCPSTGQEIATGIACDWATFNDLAAAEPGRLRCPSCGGEHAWTVEEAWLAPVATATGPEQQQTREFK
jgi:hypothetical protein